MIRLNPFCFVNIDMRRNNSYGPWQTVEDSNIHSEHCAIFDSQRPYIDYDERV